jgi:hypothetical protein
MRVLFELIVTLPNWLFKALTKLQLDQLTSQFHNDRLNKIGVNQPIVQRINKVTYSSILDGGMN